MAERSGNGVGNVRKRTRDGNEHAAMRRDGGLSETETGRRGLANSRGLSELMIATAAGKHPKYLPAALSQPGNFARVLDHDGNQ